MRIGIGITPGAGGESGGATSGGGSGAGAGPKAGPPPTGPEPPWGATASGAGRGATSGAGGGFGAGSAGTKLPGTDLLLGRCRRLWMTRGGRADADRHRDSQSCNSSDQDSADGAAHQQGPAGWHGASV